MVGELSAADNIGQSGIAPAEAAAIHDLIDDLIIAWNAGDGEAYGQAFTEECDYITFNGDRHVGRDAVAASHQNLFDTHLADSKLLFESIDMRPLGAVTILVHGIGNSLLKGQDRPHTSRRSIQTLVAVSTPVGWRFAAFHNTRMFKITAVRAVLMKFGL